MKSNWTHFNNYLYKHWKLQALVILLGIVLIPLGLLNPYLVKLVIDKAYGNRDLNLFVILSIVSGMFFLLNSLLEAVSQYFSQQINRQVTFDLTRDFFAHLQKLPLSFYDNHSTGEHIYKLDSDVRSVSGFVCNIVPKMVLLIPKLVFILVVVFYLNWQLAMFAILLVPITYIHPFFFGKILRDASRKTILKSQGIFKNLQEVFSHIHLVKALGKEGFESKQFEEMIEQRMGFELENAKFNSISNFSGSILNKIVGGMVAMYGGYMVIQGTMTLGSLTAVMLYLQQLISHLKTVGNFYQEITVNSVNRHRLEELLNIRPVIADGPGSVDHEIKDGAVELKNVFFGYKKNDPVLKGINLRIKAREKVALIGLSGCGKSTILSLILRLYEPEKGEILVDGLEIKKIKLDSLKPRIQLVLQEAFLWNTTIANNILYGSSHLTQEDMVSASKLAEAHGFIMKFPHQYESVIGEMACKISEGQKQRIAMARALVQKPKILILDEAMSSLDSETEDKVMDNIKREFKDSTVIVVSHRLSSVRKMDRIFFLKGGSLVKTGTHEELLEREPEYGELFASQVQ